MIMRFCNQILDAAERICNYLHIRAIKCLYNSQLVFTVTTIPFYTRCKVLQSNYGFILASLKLTFVKRSVVRVENRHERYANNNFLNPFNT